MNITRTCALGVALCVGLAFSAHQLHAQGTYQPFGLDGEELDQGLCSPTYNNGSGSTCPYIDAAASIGAQWIRIFAIWHDIQPTSTTYNWGTLPYAVWYAQQKGISIYFTATWAPQWANGYTCTNCNPISNCACNGNSCGSCDVGRTVTNSQYTYNFFYNLVSEFNGSSTTGCSTNASTCHPLVQYFGVWNEPDGLNNYWDNWFDSNLANYLNDYVTQYLAPAHNAIKAANPSAYVVASEMSTGTSVRCGGYTGSCYWNTSWLQPLNQYFYSLYDVISVHGYNTEQTDKSHIDTIWNTYDSGKPIWMTETAYTPASNLTAVYVDQHNRDSYWTKVFYRADPFTQPCTNTDSVFCTTTGGATITITPYGTAFDQVYAPH
jgi:hypothetical protein